MHFYYKKYIPKCKMQSDVYIILVKLVYNKNYNWYNMFYMYSIENYSSTYICNILVIK